MSTRATRNIVALVLGVVLGMCAHSCAHALKAGAVVAYNLASCPDGWSPVAGLAGRVIVGTGTLGSDTYALGATGGSARHTLTEAEMPSHYHSEDYVLSWNAVGTQMPSPSSLTPYNGYFNIYYRNATGSTGGDQPHENRQPFLALLYCALDSDEEVSGMNTVGALGITPAEALYALLACCVVICYALGFVVGQQR